MNDSPQRRKVLVLCLVGGALVLALFVLSLLASPGPPSGLPVLRPDATTQPVQPGSEDGSGAFSLGVGGLLSLAWRLGLVIIIIAVSVIGLRWWGRKTAGPKSQGGFLRVVDTLPIGNGRTIHLVSIGDRVIAIGATPQSVAFLTNLDPDEAATVLGDRNGPLPQSLSSFATELFQSVRRRRDAEPVPGELSQIETDSPLA